MERAQRGSSVAARVTIKLVCWMKVFTYFDYAYGECSRVRCRAVSGHFKQDARTLQQTLIVLPIRRTKHFCPDIIGVIAKHLWTMRESSSDVEIVPNIDVAPKYISIDTVIQDCCAKLGVGTEHTIFIDDIGDDIASRIPPDAMIIKFQCLF